MPHLCSSSWRVCPRYSCLPCGGSLRRWPSLLTSRPARSWPGWRCCTDSGHWRGATSPIWRQVSSHTHSHWKGWRIVTVTGSFRAELWLVAEQSSFVGMMIFGKMWLESHEMRLFFRLVKSIGGNVILGVIQEIYSFLFKINWMNDWMNEWWN